MKLTYYTLQNAAAYRDGMSFDEMLAEGVIRPATAQEAADGCMRVDAAPAPFRTTRILVARPEVPVSKKKDQRPPWMGRKPWWQR